MSGAKAKFAQARAVKRIAATRIQRFFRRHRELELRCNAFAEKLKKPGGVVERYRMQLIFGRWRNLTQAETAKWKRGVTFSCQRVGLAYVDGQAVTLARKLILHDQGVRVINLSDGTDKILSDNKFSNIRRISISSSNKSEVTFLHQNYFSETYNIVDACGFLDALDVVSDKQERKSRRAEIREKAKLAGVSETLFNLNEPSMHNAERKTLLGTVRPPTTKTKPIVNMPSVKQGQTAVGEMDNLSLAMKATLLAEVGYATVGGNTKDDVSQLIHSRSATGGGRRRRSNTSAGSINSVGEESRQMDQAASSLFTPLHPPWEGEYIETSAAEAQRMERLRISRAKRNNNNSSMDFVPRRTLTSGDGSQYLRGETVEQWMDKLPDVPKGNCRSRIYIAIVGDEGFDDACPHRGALVDFVSAYFHGTLVETLPPIPIRGEYRERGLRIPIKLGVRKDFETGQIVLCRDRVLQVLKRAMPHDAFAVIAVTMYDLYSSNISKVTRKKGNKNKNQKNDDNPVASAVSSKAKKKKLKRNRMVERQGLGNGPGKHVAVLSLARVDPIHHHDNSDLPLVQVSFNERRVTLFRESCLLLLQQVMLLFDIDHCVFFQCAMNGFNSLDELACIPLNLCPVCLRKLFEATGIHTVHRCVERYSSIRVFCHVHQDSFKRDIKWYGARIDYLEKVRDKALTVELLGGGSATGGNGKKGGRTTTRRSSLMDVPL